MFEKVLIANRGEIAIRVARTLREMGIGSVAVYRRSTATRRTCATPTRRSCSARPSRRSSDLNIAKIIAVAKEAGAEGIHPGYGFLAENAEDGARLRRGRDHLDRAAAGGDRNDGLEDPRREIMKAAGLPIVPGSTEVAPDLEAARKQADEARLSGRLQGGGRWRRQGLPGRDDGG